MLSREEQEKWEVDKLASYAAKSSISKGRHYQEKEHPYRTAFQRDRDRIIHCSAFRRLEYKTQVFVYHEGDYYRTRLTHTIEVSQISRSIAKALSLNEDVAEAVALAHDLGHPPFGHSGEHILNDLMNDNGGFEHNLQSLRIVKKLEKRYLEYPGLNLTQEVLEGMSKHSTEYDKPQATDDDNNMFPLIESQIVDFADGIAYNSHDLDDGVTSDLINEDMLSDVRLWRDNFDIIEKNNPSVDFTVKKYQVIRSIINQLVTDLVSQTLKNIKKHNIQKPENVKNCSIAIVSFSPEMEEKNSELKTFLYKNLYKHHRVVRMELKAEKIIKELFQTYLNRHVVLPPKEQRKMEQESKERVICDYIAGMTDRYAMDEYKKLFDPYSRV
jgi:dGTPase